MKQLSLLAMLLCTLAVTSRASIFSGTVTNAATGMPVTSQKVYLLDSGSTRFWEDSTVTNSSGQYSFTLPSSVAGGDYLYARTSACGATKFSGGFYGGINMTGQDFSVCGSSSTTYSLNGFLRMPLATTTHRAAIVYLILKQYDPVVADTTLTAIDSIGVIYPGGANTYFYKTYSVIPSGTLLLKAALLPTDSEYINYLPTYYDTVMQWSSAKQLTSANFSSSTDITMKRGTNPGGPGFIGGSVILGANKSTGAGDPLAKRIIFLTNATTGKAVAYTYSDAAGKFSFPNLAYGTYKMFGDVWGKKNPSLTVTISAAAGSVSNVLFKENKKDFTGQIGGLSVSGVNPLLADISAYPNPARDYVEVGGLTAISGSKTITLSALTGAIISRQEVAAGQNPRFSTASLAAGMYLLRVQTAEGAVQLKIAK